MWLTLSREMCVSVRALMVLASAQLCSGASVAQVAPRPLASFMQDELYTKKLHAFTADDSHYLPSPSRLFGASKHNAHARTAPHCIDFSMEYQHYFSGYRWNARHHQLLFHLPSQNYISLKMGRDTLIYTYKLEERDLSTMRFTTAKLMKDRPYAAAGRNVEKALGASFGLGFLTSASAPGRTLNAVGVVGNYLFGRAADTLDEAQYRQLELLRAQLAGDVHAIYVLTGIAGEGDIDYVRSQWMIVTDKNQYAPFVVRTCYHARTPD